MQKFEQRVLALAICLTILCASWACWQLVLWFEHHGYVMAFGR